MKIFDDDTSDQADDGTTPNDSAAADAFERAAVDLLGVGAHDGDDQVRDAPQGPPTRDVLVMVLGPLFNALRPTWGVTDKEVELLADGWAPVIDKYFPEFNLGVELNAALITVMVLGPRLGSRKAERVDDDQDGA